MPRRTRDAAIALLVLVNLVLLCAVLAQAISLPKADAQVAAGGQGGGQFLAVSGQVQSGLDAEYVIDATHDRLFVLSPSRTGGNLAPMELTDMRDLKADFAKQPAPTVPPRGRR